MPFELCAVILTVANLMWQVSMIGIPVSIAIAILRYRLWDINVLIRRTLVYAGLSATLAVVFLGSVTLFQMGFTAITGQRSAAATVLSTLLIAALFTPLRKRIQNDIDRRFFRKKYDAEKTLADFSSSLRQEVDLKEMNEQLLAVVEESMQPEKIIVWMKTTANKRQEVGE